jgi:hypothetical protein
MSWHPIGYRTVGALDGEVRIGRFAGTLPGGVLHLRAAYHGTSGPDPLSFGILDFLDDDGIRSVGSQKWWPKPQPSAVSLGPCPVAEVEGAILFSARSYNVKWLELGLPQPQIGVSVQAWLPVGVSEPIFCPSSLIVGADEYKITGSPVGPSSAYTLGLVSA